MELQVGVKILLSNPEGRYLLLERNPEKYPDVSERWDLVGGRIEVGESLLHNLKREVLEETGLLLHVEPRLVAAQDIITSTGKHVVRLTYVGQIEGKPSLQGEHISYKWLTWVELNELEGLDRYFKALLESGVLKE